MKKINYTVLLILIAIIFASCSTSINVRVDRPAELDLSYAETIAVFPFSEEPDFWDYLFLGTDSFDLANYFTNKLQSELINSGYFTVVSPTQAQSDLKNGKTPACDIYITGNIYNLYTEIEEVELEEPEEYLGKVFTKEYYRTLNYSLAYNIVDSATGKIIRQVDKTYSTESSCEYEKSKLPNACELAEDQLEEVVSSLMKQISPYTVSKSITLLKDKTKNPQMKYADELVKNGNLTLAYKEFIACSNQTGMFEAGYNAACILEAQEKYTDAESLMLELYNRTGNTKAKEALNDIRYEINSKKRFETQQETRTKNNIQL